MGTAKGMLDFYRSHIGLGEPNFIQAWYRKRNGSAYSGNFAWCDATVTYAADHSDNYDAVCFGKDHAYTVEHAQVFKNHGQWHNGDMASVKKALPGDIVFFDWGGANGIGVIDHVGIVEKNLGGGRLQTLEGNAGDRLGRHVRSSSIIAGYGRPKYAPVSPTERIVKELPELKSGAKSSEDMQTLRALLRARSHPEVDEAGAWDAKVTAAVKAFQKYAKIDVDSVVGTDTWAALLRVK